MGLSEADMSTEDAQPQEPIDEPSDEQIDADEADAEEHADETTDEDTELVLYDTVSPGEPELDEYYWKLRSYVSMLTDGVFDSLAVVAAPGIGKTYQISSALERDVGEHNYVKVSGYCSPLSLYHKLYEARGGVLFLDDVSGIPKDERSIELLKAATDTQDGDRVVSWESTSGKVECPNSFVFDGSIIMVFNQVPDSDMLKPLYDRSMDYRLTFTYAERLHIMREVAKVPYKDLDLSYAERMEAIDFIEENTGPGDDVSLRTMDKVFKIRVGDPDRWTELAEDQVNPDQELQIVRQLLEDHDVMGDAVAEFKSITDQSRATFYRRKKEIVEDADAGLTAAEAMA